MGAMPSSLQSKPPKLFDPIRQKWVIKTAEEQVRQRFLSYLLEECGFPKGLITVEKGVRGLPFSAKLCEKNKRRCDLLCYGPKLAFPLLLVECKAFLLKKSMWTQVWGYNVYIKAPFVALVNQTELRMEWIENGRVKGCDFIPPYRELVERCRL